MKIRIVYLLNSGFLVDFGNTLLIFDAFDDPAGVIDKTLADKTFNNIYFFNSHIHFDHFNGFFLGHYGKVTTQYILSEDIKSSSTIKHIPTDKISWMRTYDYLEIADNDHSIKVTSYDSTDAGTSFQVEVSNLNIFHAGDYNWWDWIGDTADNRKMAENAFRKQLKNFDNKSFDIVFFPVDGRLEETMEKGITEFCNYVEVNNLISMHSVSYPEWVPTINFLNDIKYKPITIWSPRLPGLERTYEFF